jgi:hypothetical protein
VKAQNYAISKGETNPEVQDYNYSAIFEFDGQNEEASILHMTGRGVNPMIKVSRFLMNFGECDVN